MMRHSVNNNTHMGLVIFLCPNSNHLISLIPQTASNFRHLLSCGTIVLSLRPILRTNSEASTVSKFRSALDEPLYQPLLS